MRVLNRFAQSRIITRMSAISDTSTVLALRRGLSLMVPWLVAGSLCLFVLNLPIPAYQNWMISLFGEGWKSFLLHAYNGTFSVLAIGMVFSISYCLAEVYAKNNRFYSIISSLTALGSYFASLVFETDSLPTQFLGALGMPGAIFIAVSSTLLLNALYKIRFLRLKVYSDVVDEAVAQAMAMLLPALITLFVFAILHKLLQLWDGGNLQEALANLLRSLWPTDSVPNLFSAVFFVFLGHLFWFFGLHGLNLLEGVATTVFEPNLAVNQAAVAAGQAPPEVLTKVFFDAFVFLGGAGATLSLIIAIFWAGRRNHARKLAGASILPGLINVNEIMLFGLPVAFNIYMFIPFLLTPVALTLTSYAAMVLGLVPLTVDSMDWTTPIFLSGYMATRSVAGALLQLVNLALGVLIYRPFVKLYETASIGQGKKTMRMLVDEVLSRASHQKYLLDRRDSLGNLARSLAMDLEDDYKTAGFYMEYQPQFNEEACMVSMEALLRWKHPVYDNIPPPVPVALAHEADVEGRLAKWVFDEVCAQILTWQAKGYPLVPVSLNMSPRQITPGLLDYMRQALQKVTIPHGLLVMEFTEDMAFGISEATRWLLAEFRSLGIGLAMDDFGMGHSSLLILKEFDVDVIKLDGTLVRDLLTNAVCREIIASVVQLCQNLNVKVVAEYVETEAQRDALLTIGCHIFQGYLFSPSLPSHVLQERYWQTIRP